MNNYLSKTADFTVQGTWNFEKNKYNGIFRKNGNEYILEIVCEKDKLDTNLGQVEIVYGEGVLVYAENREAVRMTLKNIISMSKTTIMKDNFDIKQRILIRFGGFYIGDFFVKKNTEFTLAYVYLDNFSSWASGVGDLQIVPVDQVDKKSLGIIIKGKKALNVQKIGNLNYGVFNNYRRTSKFTNELTVYTLEVERNFAIEGNFGLEIHEDITNLLNWYQLLTNNNEWVCKIVLESKKAKGEVSYFDISQMGKGIARNYNVEGTIYTRDKWRKYIFLSLQKWFENSTKFLAISRNINQSKHLTIDSQLKDKLIELETINKLWKLGGKREKYVKRVKQVFNKLDKEIIDLGISYINRKNTIKYENINELVKRVRTLRNCASHNHSEYEKVPHLEKVYFNIVLGMFIRSWFLKQLGIPYKLYINEYKNNYLI